MYYLRSAFDRHGYPRLGSFMAAAFAVCCIGGTLGAGGLFQVNQAYHQALIITEVTLGFWQIMAGYLD